jgi:hypothetical protein
VLRKGIPKGLIINNPYGGQELPTSTDGLIEISKNTQKILKKNINSLKINKIIPYLKPS